MDSLGYESLPRGRHHLTREQVAASQRERLLQSVIEVVGEKGYAASTVADVLKRAHVSRETFYRHFADKRACFLAAYAAAAERMVAVVTAAAGSEDLPPLQRLDRAIGAYLRELAADGARARTFLVEVYALGASSAAARFAVQQRFAELMHSVMAADERWRRLPDPQFAGRMIVGGVAALVTGKVAAGEHASLPSLRAPILTHVRSLLGA
ncbi:hypothetical protein Arub01_26810 [Actinomadura rubrobrunea]|uniref:HTH tetR-type domain-containing protein n=1 Tax=Actinomadura rubrobrunea TaxID=115335 RepID=A0A9W6PX98_9ACTN|nr:TetR/AcrR family transcriptional regulator [Actinomadura rubrobrunea]GLW64437.1 hypothetical protein Arub01_26810 [Actinomadura rubrobrunea]